MPKLPEKPVFVNRGAAGLLNKLPEGVQKIERVAVVDKGINNISPSLKHLAVDISSLVPDPLNARLHPEKNMESIRHSLQQYGQKKPVVVRKEGMIIVAGNGTYEAAKELGWTIIAANIEDMDHVEAIGYGIADNRTAELAKWNGPLLGELVKQLTAEKHSAIGWSIDELSVLHMSEWVPPAITDYAGGETNGKEEVKTLKFTDAQYPLVIAAVEKLRTIMQVADITQEECVAQVCKNWLEGL